MSDDWWLPELDEQKPGPARLPWIWPDGSDHIGHAECDPCRLLPVDGGAEVRRRLAEREAAIEAAITKARNWYQKD